MGEHRGLKYVWRTATRAPHDLLHSVGDLHPAVVQVLYGRGLTSRDACFDFLAGVTSDSDEPTLLADVPRAVERLVRARAAGEQVAVFTDYDADGVNAAAVLASGLRLLGIDPLVRLPNRFLDGYGLTSAAVEELAGRGARVIVTADCGSSAHEAAETARALGVDLVVTDHHQCPPELPRAYAVINPWRPDCEYPCDYLCGAGVAYKLLQALADALLPGGRAAMEPLLDLVAVATVADIVPLVAENRRLLIAGLRLINTAPRPGIHALVESAGLQPGGVDAPALAFRVAPRINAAGRMDDPGVAYRLLMAETLDEAIPVAAELNQLNQARQQLSRDLEQRATELVRVHVERGDYTVICGGDGWAQGLVGLVAGKLAQLYHRPALVYSVRDSTASGSGRGIPDFDLLAALRACDDLFTRYGGHRLAAGFSLPSERLNALRERFEAAARATLTREQLQPVLQLDGYLRPETVSLDFVRALERLGPFGAGFTAPTFGMRHLRVLDSRTVGDGVHWKVRLHAPGTGVPPLSAIYWHQGALADRVRPGTHVDAAFQLKASEWPRGHWYPQLDLQDIALA